MTWHGDPATKALSLSMVKQRAQMLTGIYGRPDPDLVSILDGAVQFSPLIPGAARFEDHAGGSFASLVMLAPASVIERRFALAQALRVLTPGGQFTVLAPKDRGGNRLADELAGFGCAVETTSRRHHRICHCTRPAQPVGLDDAIAAGCPQIPAALGLWSQPGIFSWDRPDPGSLALIRHLPQLAGAGADFGCGVGLLARAVLESPAVTRLSLLDIDRRAIGAAQRNVTDERAAFAWHNLRQDLDDLRQLDFVVMNPPFHDGGIEDRALGEIFIRRAGASLRRGGACWLVANRHLPYERYLTALFSSVRQVEQAEGYKIYEARR
jgi:16S rRNA (guanine1207-N2)-methyltransferase